MLRDMRVEFCMAPYEADPQVVFMNTDVDAQYRGDIVITEDSDILALGANVRVRDDGVMCRFACVNWKSLVIAWRSLMMI